MFKVVFADDEILTREAIAENTPWEECGFILAGTAENGKKAVELIEKVHPQLLITDICMPGMDGLELASYAKEHYPDMIVYILSGYDEFDYAKKAMKYGVSEYILKPITSAELKDELARAYNELEKKDASRVKIEKMQTEYEKSLPLVREHFLNRLLEGRENTDKIDSHMTALEISFHGSFQSVMLVGTMDKSDWKTKHPDISESLMNFIIFNITEELMLREKNVIVMRNINDRCIVIVARDSAQGLADSEKRIGDSIIEMISRFIELNICIVVGKTVSAPDKWQISYDNARNAEEYKYLYDQGGILYGADFAVQNGETDLQIAPWGSQLELAIKIGRKDDISRIVSEMFGMFKAAKCDRQTLQLHIQNCVLAIIIMLKKTEDVTECEMDKKASFIYNLDSFAHLSDIEESFLDFCMQIAGLIAGKRENGNQTIAVAAMDYIEKNYMNPDISLNTVCDYLNLSVSYFSMVFKNCTKKTFVEALTQVRIDKARNLLDTTSSKAYEVAVRVGYNDPHYFSAIFKKNTGMTPTDYIRRRDRSEQ